MFKSITKKIKNRGFTLIELLVVITIIGILAGIIIISVGDAIDRARLARVKSFARTIQTDLALDAVGIWRFDDDPQPGADDGVHDASGWGNHGTLHIGANGTGCDEGTWVEGVFGKALCFDGEDDFVDAGNDASLDITEAVTVEAWVNHNHVGGAYQRIFTKERTYALGIVNDRVRFLTTPNWAGTILAGNTLLSGGTWYHIVVTYDGSIKKAYVNGEQEANTVLKSGPMESRPTDKGFIGAMGTRAAQPTSLYFNGLIDEVRIYNRALQVFEIQDRYVKGLESLLARGLIDQEAFNNRMAEIEKNLAAK